MSNSYAPRPKSSSTTMNFSSAAQFIRPSPQSAVRDPARLLNLNQHENFQNTNQRPAKADPWAQPTRHAQPEAAISSARPLDVNQHEKPRDTVQRQARVESSVQPTPHSRPGATFK